MRHDSPLARKGCARGGDGSLLEDFKPVLRYDSDEGYLAATAFVSVVSQAGLRGYRRSALTHRLREQRHNGRESRNGRDASSVEKQ